MPTSTWNTTTIDGVEYLVVMAQLRIPKDFDETSNVFIAVAAPSGGLLNYPALVKGDTGDPPDLSAINYTFLAATDPTPDSASWTELSPGIWQLNLVIHKGPKGEDGDTVIDLDDYGTPLPNKMLVVNPAMTSFEYQTQKVGDRYVPASIANAPAGNSVYTLCSVSVPAQGFDWRPDVSGQCMITGSFSTRTDLIARLNNEVSGNIVGRGFGKAVYAYGDIQTVTMSSGPPTNSSTTYDKVVAGSAAVIYLRAEVQVGSSGTFTTTAADTHFCVRVRPIPPS